MFEFKYFLQKLLRIRVAIIFVALNIEFVDSRQPELPQMSIKDVVDKTREVREVSLSIIDFLSAGDTSEVDLRLLGIAVPDDPTLGSGTNGDIARPKMNKIKNALVGDKQIMRDENGIARASIRQPYRKWPNNEIPYALSSQYGAYSRSIIAKAMNEYHAKTCVRFVARDPRKHRDYVYIHPDDGCYSLVGRVGGRQPLSLDSGCIQTGTIVHELMHAVGFFHEQSRYDRDTYIDISWVNVAKLAYDQFEKYGVNVIDQLNEPYDYSSIMHYGPYAFTANGRRTIVPRRAGADKMGQRIAFSEIDLRKINKLYQCGGNIAAPATNFRPPSSSSGVVVSPSSQVSGVCEDESWRCLFWSLPELDYCGMYAEVRYRICRKSCGTCATVADFTGIFAPNSNQFEKTKKSQQKSECADRSLNCGRIARSEELSCLMPLTRRMCARSCSVCAPGDAELSTIVDEDAQLTKYGETEVGDNIELKPPLDLRTVSGRITISANSGGGVDSVSGSGGELNVEFTPQPQSKWLIMDSFESSNDAPPHLASFTPPPPIIRAVTEPSCIDFSNWRVCRNVVAAQMCSMRNDCLRTCELC